MMVFRGLCVLLSACALLPGACASENLEGESGQQSRYLGVKLPSGLGTWMIKRHDAAGWETPAYLSSLGAGESGTGLIRSRDFKLSVAKTKLSVRGYVGNGLNRVELVDAGSGEVLRTAKPPDDLGPKWSTWDVADLAGRMV
ncbi:MAG: hypothetical protein WCL39_04915, partial [Armatimonadota bacterium]